MPTRETETANLMKQHGVEEIRQRVGEFRAVVATA